MSSSVRVNQKGEITREVFKLAAREVFANKGYLNSRIKDITDRAGKAAGSFYNYYPNKAALLHEIAEDFAAKNARDYASLSLQPGTMNLQQWVAAGVEVYWRNYQRYLPELSSIFQAAMIDEHFAQRWQGIRADVHGYLALLIRRHPSILHKGLDLNLSVAAVSSMLDHFCYDWHVYGGHNNDAQAAKQTLSVIIYQGLFQPS